MNNLHIHEDGPTHLAFFPGSSRMTLISHTLSCTFIREGVPHSVLIAPVQTQSVWMRGWWESLPSLSPTADSTWFLAPTLLCIVFRDFTLSKGKRMTTRWQ